MKNVKVLASIAALATVSCMAAVSASAASSIKFELDVAKSNETTKYVNMILETDEITSVSNFMVTLDLPDSISGTSAWGTPVNIDTEYGCVDANGADISISNNKIKLAEFKIDGDFVDIATNIDVEFDGITDSTGMGVDVENCGVGKLAVVNAADLGTFKDGEGAPAKAFKAAAEAEGAITWYVTDGTNVASKAVTEVTGGADVVVGLVATGANVANINYATVTID